VIENMGAVSVWAARTSPPDAVYRAVVEWVIAAEAEPWRAPSQPIGPAGPVQLRRVLLPDIDVRITYNTEHATSILTVVQVAGIPR
jgi:hypothetical protein